MPLPPSSSSFLAMTAPPERTQYVCFSWGAPCSCAPFLQAQTHLELLNISQFCFFFSSQLQSPSVGTGLGGVTARLGGAVLWGRVGRGWSGVCESLQGWGQQCHRGHLVQVMLQEMPPRKGLWALRDCVITSHFTRSERTAHLICSHFACLVLHAFGCSWCIGSFFYCSQGFFQRGNYFFFFL